MNLLMHHANVSLPTSGKLWKHRGGTGFWYKKWEEQKKLKPFDYTKKYPLGTIFFRRYRNIKDQGHLVFLNGNTEVDKMVTYKPNRAVIFPASVMHYGDAPHRKFNGLRISLAYKLWRVNE